MYLNCFKKEARKESDVWSIGIILLFFYYKENVFNNYYINSLRLKFKPHPLSSVIEYKMLYGDIECAKKCEEITALETEYKDFFSADPGKFKRSDENSAEDLIGKMLEFDYNKRISIDNDLKHPFFRKKKKWSKT